VTIDIKGLKKTPWKLLLETYIFIKKLRTYRYDVLWDLQGNCKSALVTYFAWALHKVGFGRRSVAEWPNLIATNITYEVCQTLPISMQYLSLLKSYYQDFQEEVFVPHRLTMPAETIPMSLPSKNKIMVCPGSNWANKQLSEETLLEFLQLLKKKYSPFFVLIWGSDKEKVFINQLASRLSEDVLVVGALDLAVWQNLMCRMDCVLSVDSCSLHLAALVNVPTFSVFGPSSCAVYKPFGDKHSAYAAQCPYGKVFVKRCPQLRTCVTGACMKEITAEALMEHFVSHMKLRL
jgi:heptosyltransferase-1